MWGQQHTLQSTKESSVVGEARNILRLNEAGAGHLSFTACLALPVLWGSHPLRAELQTHSPRQRLATTGCAVDPNDGSMEQAKIKINIC